jgi:hypothetical protein
VAKHTRAQVRAARARAVARAKRMTVLLHGDPHRDTRMVQGLATDRKVCSCYICNSYSRPYAGTTLQERRQDDALDRQLEDAIFATEKAVLRNPDSFAWELSLGSLKSQRSHIALHDRQDAALAAQVSGYRCAWAGGHDVWTKPQEPALLQTSQPPGPLVFGREETEEETDAEH